MSMNIVPLPLSGDLWRPPVFDADGNITPRPDTLDATKLPEQAVSRSADVQAILMAELAEQVAKAKK